MKMLVINSGSSSLKFTVFDFSWLGKEEVLATGQVECIGQSVSHLIYEKGERKSTTDIQEDEPLDHSKALEKVVEKLENPEDGVIKGKDDILAIGHRVVHGGEKIKEPVIVNDEIKGIIRECFSLAPLHNPPNLSGIEACEKNFPNVPNVAIFDTAFHQTMPPEAYIYAIPYDLYEKQGIRKYGFHGTSHHYVGKSTAEHLKVSFDELKLITCHLGNGASMSAINKGKVIDTSMGLTPLEGLVMGTRCGDLDPAIVLRLIEEGMAPKEVDTYLNKKSGLYGVAGINSGDMREIEEAAEKGKKHADLAIRLYIRRIVKYAGAYSALLNGADAIVFSGGVGEHDSMIRRRVLESLGYLGVYVDNETNDVSKGEGPAVISTTDSKMKAIVMPTNEELMIAKQSIELLLKKNKLRLVAV